MSAFIKDHPIKVPKKPNLSTFIALAISLEVTNPMEFLVAVAHKDSETLAILSLPIARFLGSPVSKVMSCLSKLLLSASSLHVEWYTG